MKQTAVDWLLDMLDYNQQMLGVKEIIEQDYSADKLILKNREVYISSQFFQLISS